MADQDKTEADERDEEDLDERDDDEVESEREPEPKTKASTEKPRSGQARASAAAASEGVSSGRVGLFVALALALGGAAGWFGHIQQAKAALRADSATASSDSGPCGAWTQKICGSAGKQSAACQQAKGAAELLTPLTCQDGLEAMPATLNKLKTARSGCDKLVTKLCGDLPPGSKTCDMVKERTPQFPAQRCDEMLQHYDEVIAELKKIDEAGAMQMGGPGGPGGPGPVVSSPH